MGNMRHCMFENTYNDLHDCWEALIDTDINNLSESERRYALRLIRLARTISDEFEEFTLNPPNELQDEN